MHDSVKYWLTGRAGGFPDKGLSFADGSTRAIRAGIDPKIIHKLISRHAQEKTGLDVLFDY